MNVEYVLATHADIDKLIDIRIEFGDELVGKQEPSAEALLRKNLLTYFQEELNKHYICWYAIIDGTITSIGGMVIKRMPPNIKNPSGMWGYIVNIYTIPAYRRKGLCSNILKKLTDSAAEKGLAAVELHATEAGAHAYEKNGFFLHNEPSYRKFINHEYSK